MNYLVCQKMLSAIGKKTKQETNNKGHDEFGDGGELGF